MDPMQVSLLFQDLTDSSQVVLRDRPAGHHSSRCRTGNPCTSCESGECFQCLSPEHDDLPRSVVDCRNAPQVQEIICLTCVSHADMWLSESVLLLDCGADCSMWILHSLIG